MTTTTVALPLSSFACLEPLAAEAPTLIHPPTPQRRFTRPALERGAVVARCHLLTAACWRLARTGRAAQASHVPPTASAREACRLPVQHQPASIPARVARPAAVPTTGEMQATNAATATAVVQLRTASALPAGTVAAPRDVFDCLLHCACKIACSSTLSTAFSCWMAFCLFICEPCPCCC